MENKKKFLNSVKEEERLIFSSLFDKASLSEKSGRTIFSNEFYGPNIWSALERINNEFSTNVFSFGLFEEAERRMLCFSLEHIVKYPMVLIKITNKSNFNELKHKDYLGAMMSLGIKREKFGDLIVDENQCMVAAAEDICDYVALNLESIGRCPCKIEIIRDFESIDIKSKFQEAVINCSSLRVDCLVSALTNLSRSKTEELIRQGKILIDYSSVLDKDKNLEENSVITIRGFGKFKVMEKIGCTAKGRNKVLIKKYI